MERMHAERRTKRGRNARGTGGAGKNVEEMHNCCLCSAVIKGGKEEGKVCVEGRGKMVRNE